jgi:hypothetical protein
MKQHWTTIPRDFGSAFSRAFQPFEHPPMNRSAGNPRDIRHSLAGGFMLLAVAIGGAIGLGRLAHHVATPATETNGGILVRSEVVSLWLHPALFDLAERPAEPARRSYQAFRRFAEERGIQRAWYVSTVKGFQINGQTILLTTICRPYEMDSSRFLDFSNVLDSVAGNPPGNLSINYATAKIGVIPDYLLAVDPRSALEELNLLEHLPDPEMAP